MRKPCFYFPHLTDYKFNSILVRNFFIIVLVLILPLSAISAAVYEHSKTMVVNQSYNINLQAVRREKDVMDTIFGEMISMEFNISQTYGMGIYLENGDSNYLEHLTDTIKIYSKNAPYLDSIYVYSEKTNHIISNSNSGDFQWFNDTGWYPFYKGLTSHNITFLSRKGTLNDSYLLSFCLPLFNYRNIRLGCIVVNIDLRELSNLIEKKDGRFSQYLYISDQNNAVIYSRDVKGLSRKINELSDLKRLKNPSDPNVQAVGMYSGDSIISTIPSDYFGWNYISVLPMQYFEKDFKELKDFIIWLILIAVAVALGISAVIAFMSYLPLKNIISVLMNPDTGTTLNRSDQGNEMGYITGSIVNTLKSNQKLESELKERVMMLHKAQAATLQAQINPHFLYNTLEVINWKAVELLHGKNEISDMLTNLSKLYRMGLDLNHYLIPLREELAYAELYIDILKMRYADMFDVIFNINENILGCLVPKVCLQPLIENAVCHGIKPSGAKGTVQISADMNGARYVELRVINDGILPTEEEIRELNRKMALTDELDSEHIGMQNVNQRIKLVFGIQYGIRIDCQAGRTTVKADFPAFEQHE